MSQNADSARDWINRDQPDSEQLQRALSAIQRKISDHPQLHEQQRSDLEGAAKVVQEELELAAYSLDSDSDNLEPSLTADLTPLGADTNAPENLDLSQLGQAADPNIQPLNGSAKRQAFEQLKNSISNLKG